MYLFFKDGEQIQSIEAKSLKEAEEKSGLKVSEETGISYSVVETKKTRQPRADKGTKRNVDNKKKNAVNRKRPEYFIFTCSVSPLTHNEALEAIEVESNPGDCHIIMGHEISFSRSVKFHV